MKKIILFSFLVLFVFGIHAFGQIAINNDNTLPDNSAMLDVKSTSKGMLVPRMTSVERDAISNPATGLLIFCTTDNQFYSNKGTPTTPLWILVNSQWISSGTDIYFNTGKVGLGIQNPVYSLDVAGDINFSGTLRNNGLPFSTGVTSVAATTPLVSSEGTTPVISMPQASSVSDGFLSAGDWSIFHNKQNLLTLGNLSSPDLTITGGTGSVIGSGVNISVNKGNLVESGSAVLEVTEGEGVLLGNGASIEVKEAGATQSGYLSQTDWTAFNNKVSSQWITSGTDIYFNTGKVGLGIQNPVYSLDVAGDINFSGTLRNNGLPFSTGVTSVAAATPLASSGGTTPVISMPQATSVSDGFLSAGDWSIFHNKQNLLTLGNLSSPDLTITGGTGSVIGSGVNISVNKGSLVESGSAVLEITEGEGVLLGNGASIEVKEAGATQSGYLSQTDWTAFNNKVSSQWSMTGTTLSYGGGQVLVGTAPSPGSAVFTVNSTTQGMLMPRMNIVQRNAILNPVDGLMVFCLDCGSEGSMSFYSNGTWKTLMPCETQSPTPGSNGKSPGQITWTWNPAPGATGYKWNAENNYATALDMGVSLTKTETGMLCNNTYTRYVWAYNTCSCSIAAILTETVASSAPPMPVAGTHLATTTQIVWNWNVVTGAIGYKWSANNNPSLATSVGSLTSYTETGLVCGTTYTRYVWAYNGCGYSSPVALTQSTASCWSCGLPITDTRDGKTYNTVLIGSQCWMAQNLNVGVRVDGPVEQTNNGILEKYCYNNQESNCDTYGGLYQWAEMVQYLNGATNTSSWSPAPVGFVSGICPAGWHIPSDAEWTTATTLLGGESVAGGKMKETGTGHWATPNFGATNTSGFTALPGAYRYYNGGAFQNLTYTAHFWTTLENSATTVWLREMDHDKEYVLRFSWNKTLGYSVRCVLD